jgi:hypothetical protein
LILWGLLTPIVLKANRDLEELIPNPLSLGQRRLIKTLDLEGPNCGWENEQERPFEGFHQTPAKVQKTTPQE